MPVGTPPFRAAADDRFDHRAFPCHASALTKRSPAPSGPADQRLRVRPCASAEVGACSDRTTSRSSEGFAIELLHRSGVREGDEGPTIPAQIRSGSKGEDRLHAARTPAGDEPVCLLARAMEIARPRSISISRHAAPPLDRPA